MSLQRLLLLALSLALVAAPVQAGEEGDNAALPERDDPYARLVERQLRFGPRQPEDAARILQEAHRASRHAALAGQRVQGAAWINLGPSGAAFEKNGVTYSKVDSGRINKVLVHPSDPNVVYLATSGGGVWKTFDAQAPVTYSSGPRWTPITDQLGSLAVGSIALDPQNPETLVLGLGDPFDVQVPGLVYSTDGGGSWSAPMVLAGAYPGHSAVMASSVRDVQFDQAGSGVVLVATDAGLFRSQQGGVGPDWQLVDLAADHSAQDCWSAAWVGQGTWVVACDGALFRSTDGGASWLSVRSGLPSAAQTRAHRMTVAAAYSDRADPQRARVYLLAAAADVTDPATGEKRWGTLDVFRSDDGGRSFPLGLGVNTSGRPANENADQTDLDVLHDQAWYNQMLVVDPRNRDNLFVGGNLSLIRSRNGGASWDVMANWLPWSPANPQAHNVTYVHADWHAATISYAGADQRLVFYAGTDGGVFRSYDVVNAAAGSATFEDGLNRGIVTHLAYSVATDENDSTSTVVLGGLQDNGTRLRALVTDLSGPTFFNQVWGGDGIGVGLGRFNGGAGGSLLVVSNPGSLQRSQDGGQSFAPMMRGLPSDPLPGGNFYMKVATDFGDPQNRTFLTLANLSDGAHVYKWVDGGGATNAWQQITGSIALRAGGTAAVFGEWLNNLAADPKHPGHYAVVSSARAYVKAAGQATWAESAPLPQAGLSSIGFDPANPQILWVSSASGAAGGHVFATTDGGASWQNRSGAGLPDVPANVVKVDPNDAATIYLGTEIGLYRSTNAGQSWARHGAGLPLVSVTDLSIALDSSAIRVATYGRGFWELYPSYGAPSGVHGSGDFDGNQQLDGFDLIALSGVLGLTSADQGYTAVGNLVGATNSIDNDDLAALLARLGGRP